MDLEAVDIRGKRAIDLCPYSSPIFKTIRDCLRRRTSIHVNSQVDEETKVEGLHSNPDDMHVEYQSLKL